MILELKHIKKEYEKGNPVIRDFSADIDEGEVIAMIGPSGCGKSTLLNMINCLKLPDSGQIVFKGEEITAPGYDVRSIRGKIGMVFQNYSIFDNLTVIENLCIAPVKLLHVPAAQAYETAMQRLRHFGLGAAALKYPGELSGGQRQRVAILLAMSTDPSVLLMDEPTSALDPGMVGEISATIRYIKNMGVAVVFVTHDLKFAENTADRVFFICGGALYEEGSPEEIFHHPVRPATRAFISGKSCFDRIIATQDYDFLSLYSDLDRFCSDSRIDFKMSADIKSVFEELCFQILLPKFSSSDASLHLHIEYSSEKREAVVSASCGSLRPQRREPEDSLSWRLIEYKAESIDFSEENGMVTIHVRICAKQI